MTPTPEQIERIVHIQCGRFGYLDSIAALVREVIRETLALTEPAPPAKKKWPKLPVRIEDGDEDGWCIIDAAGWTLCMACHEDAMGPIAHAVNILSRLVACLETDQRMRPSPPMTEPTSYYAARDALLAECDQYEMPEVRHDQ